MYSDVKDISAGLHLFLAIKLLKACMLESSQSGISSIILLVFKDIKTSHQVLYLLKQNFYM